MTDYSPAWPHGNITEIFDDIYIVRGTNITVHEGQQIQHSRNMTIIKQSDELILINSVRLDDTGLEQLEHLGRVKHIVRIGAFHGRDDALYVDRYGAELWTVDDDSRPLPIENARYYRFEHANPREGYIHLQRHGGMLITCDSIKNWIEVDEYFNESTAAVAIEQGEITEARISPIWLQATGTAGSDFDALLSLDFKHLISAHGDVLFDTAHAAIQRSVNAIASN